MHSVNTLLRRAFPTWPAVPPALWGTSVGSLICAAALLWAREIWTRPAVARGYLWPLLIGLALASFGLGLQLLWRLVRSCVGPGWLRLLLYGGVVAITVGAVLGGMALVFGLIIMAASY